MGAYTLNSVNDLFLADQREDVAGVGGSGGPWSVILAGGEGERIRPLVLRWLKRPKPKQYCAFVGGSSMLQHTLARADLLSSRDRQVIVIDRTHIGDARLQIDRRPLKNLVRQPQNRDTAAGVFLPMTYIRNRDPQATVVVYPSDHFIHPKETFAATVAEAIEAAESLDRLVLLGVRPDHPEPDYGWIVPEEDESSSCVAAASRVRAFVEKPGQAAAGEAMSSGALWNTLIFAVKIERLWQMGWRCFPELMKLFEHFAGTIGSRKERSALRRIYNFMPAYNFSTDLLGKCVDQLVTKELSGVIWSDWGRPERIAETLRHLNKTPAFPWSCLEPELQPQSS